MKLKEIFLSILFLTIAPITFAQTSVEFFASNNTKEINLQTAYQRLIGKEQQDLQNSIISVMQKNHMEQGTSEDILGTYRMSNDKNITADNSEHFSTSPNQVLADETVFSIAKEIAITLNQDSVAVLIPDQSTIGNITVSFSSHQPSISEVIKLIHKKLPETYSQAFSLHLKNKCGVFDTAKVNQIEWLGSKINLEEIKKAFPQEKITSKQGKVFLIYQNGQKEQL